MPPTNAVPEKDLPRHADPGIKLIKCGWCEPLTSEIQSHDKIWKEKDTGVDLNQITKSRDMLKRGIGNIQRANASLSIALHECIESTRGCAKAFQRWKESWKETQSVPLPESWSPFVLAGIQGGKQETVCLECLKVLRATQSLVKKANKLVKDFDNSRERWLSTKLESQQKMSEAADRLALLKTFEEANDSIKLHFETLQCLIQSYYTCRQNLLGCRSTAQERVEDVITKPTVDRSLLRRRTKLLQKQNSPGRPFTDEEEEDVEEEEDYDDPINYLWTGP